MIRWIPQTNGASTDVQSLCKKDDDARSTSGRGVGVGEGWVSIPLSSQQTEHPNAIASG